MFKSVYDFCPRSNLQKYIQFSKFTYNDLLLYSLFPTDNVICERTAVRILGPTEYLSYITIYTENDMKKIFKTQNALNMRKLKYVTKNN